MATISAFQSSFDNTSMNTTGELDTLRMEGQVVGYLSLPIIILGIFTNILILGATFKTEHLRKMAASPFIVTMAMADLTIAMFYLPFTAYLRITQGGLDEGFCHFLAAFLWVLACTSIWGNTCFTINCCFAVAWPTQYYEYHKRNLVVKTLVFISVFVPVTIVAIVRGISNPKQAGLATIIHQCLITDFKARLIFFTVTVIIPFCIMLFCHVKIAFVVKISKNAQNVSSQFKQDVKLTKLALAVVISFLIFYVVPLILILISTAMNLQTWIINGLNLLVWMGFGTNAVIYGLMNTKYRRAYKMIICRCCKGDQVEPISAQTSSV